MTRLQKLQLRASEIRAKLNQLGAVEQPTDEQRAEIGKLSKEYGDLEVRQQALMIGADDPEGDGETETETETRTDDKLAELETRASVEDVMIAALNGRDPEGATRELQQELNLAGNAVPLALIRPERRDGVPEDLERRAVTPAPNDVGQNQAAIIPGVFPHSVAAFLGVDMPTVGVGEAVYPVLTQNATVHAPGEGAAATETTGSFSADVLSPSRLQASFFYSREDRARFAGMDAALRENLNAALSDALDARIVAGDDEGLLHGANLANHNAAAVTTYAMYRSQLAYGRVDGTYASMVGDTRIVMGSATYAHCAGQFRSDNAGDRAALEDLMQVTGGVRVSAHVPAVANNKQNAIVRLGSRRDAVAPIWEGVSLIPDEVTKADTGEIKITAVMLYAFKLLRSAGFYKQQTQHA